MPVPFLFTNFTAAARKPNLILFNYFGPNDSVAWIQSGISSFGTVQLFDSLCNGVTTTFTLSGMASTLFVWLNGVLQESVAEGGVDYTFTKPSSTFTMATAPQAGDQLKVAFS
jgi:hypothetical protein